jgi:hypothetical protein
MKWAIAPGQTNIIHNIGDFWLIEIQFSTECNIKFSVFSER